MVFQPKNNFPMQKDCCQLKANFNGKRWYGTNKQKSFVKPKNKKIEPASVSFPVLVCFVSGYGAAVLSVTSALCSSSPHLWHLIRTKDPIGF